MPLILTVGESDTSWVLKYFPGEVPNDTGSAYTKFEVMSKTSFTKKFRNLIAGVIN